MTDTHRSRAAAANRDRFKRLDPWTRLYLRGEYRYLRQLGLGRHTASGTLHRTLGELLLAHDLGDIEGRHAR